MIDENLYLSPLIRQELSGIDDLEHCKDILARHDWNVEAAIHEHLGLEPTRRISATAYSHITEERNGQLHRRNQSEEQHSNNSPTLGLFTRLLSPIMDDQIGSWIFPLHSPRGFRGWLLFITSLPLRIIAVTFFQITSYLYRLAQPNQRPGMTACQFQLTGFV